MAIHRPPAGGQPGLLRRQGSLDDAGVCGMTPVFGPIPLYPITTGAPAANRDRISPEEISRVMNTNRLR